MKCSSPFLFVIREFMPKLYDRNLYHGYARRSDSLKGCARPASNFRRAPASTGARGGLLPLGQDGLELGQRVADDRAQVLDAGVADRAAERPLT